MPSISNRIELLINQFPFIKVGLIGIKDKKGKGLIDDLNSRALQHEITIAEKALFNYGDADDIIDARLQQVGQKCLVRCYVAFAQYLHFQLN